MSKRLLLTLLFIAASTTLVAAEFEVRIISYPPRAIMGAPVPIVAQVQNASGKPVSIARGFTGFNVVFIVRREDGNPRQGCMPPPAMQPSLTYHAEALPVSWAVIYPDDLRCDDIPGEWIVQAVLSSRGPYPFYEGGKIKEYLKAWSGEVRSEEVHIQFQKPAGLDAEAYKYFKGCPLANPSELLQRFSASTYAAYVVWHISGAEGMGRSDPTRVIADRSKNWSPNLLEVIQVPFDEIDGKKIGGEIHGQVAIAWREKWFGIVLKNHPDIWFADELKLRSAIDQLTLKNYQTAQADLEAIAKDDKSPMAAKAKEYLGLIKQKGWIKG